MQVISDSQSIGYLVPVNMVKHFIEDMKDGHYDGFADLGLGVQKLENPTLRAYYGLEHNVTGQLVDKIVYNSSLKGILKENDILTKVDGYNIEDDGTVAFREHEYTYFHYAVDAYQMGDKVDLDIIRDKKKMKVQATLKYQADDMYLVKTTRYDKMPSYFIYGGYVFAPLTRNLILSTERNRLLLSYLAGEWQTKKKKEVVILLKVLASDLTRGSNNFAMWPIEKINGESFVDFKDFYAKMQACKEKYIVLEDKDGIKVIIDKQKAQSRQKEILRTYNIEYDKSEDLRD